MLGPFGELLTDDDLVYLQRQIETLSLQKCCQAYELELTRLTEELRAILPDPIVSISLNKDILQQMNAEGRMHLTLPVLCSRVSEIVKGMSLLVANLTQTTEEEDERRRMEGMTKKMNGLQTVNDSSGIDLVQGLMQRGKEAVTTHVETTSGCRIPHIGMASAFSHRLETNNCSRARRERVEREIKQSGVSVRELRSNFEGQIGDIYPFAGVVNGGRRVKSQVGFGTSSENSQKASAGLNHEVSHSGPKKCKPVNETHSLRKERIVLLFLSHWKKSAYAISATAGRQTQGEEAVSAASPQRRLASMFQFCKQRGAVNKVLNSWKKKMKLRDGHRLRLPSFNSQNPPARVTYSPEQFLPDVDGVAVSHDSLTLDLFMLGYFHILEQQLSPQERKMRHLLCFEVFDHVGSFPWETVRDFHKSVLQEIQAGRRQWNDGFEDIKVHFFGECRSPSAPPSSSSLFKDSTRVPKVGAQTVSPDQCSSNTDITRCNSEDICKYIDRSFAFWKEKEAELFDFGQKTVG